MDSPREILPEDMSGIQLVTHYSMALALPGGTPYVSALQAELLKRLRRLERIEADLVVLQTMDETHLMAQLAAAGYPGFSYQSSKANCNPAELLISALVKNELDARIAESLPWVVFTYQDLDWDWVMRKAKIHDVTNQLGFTVTLARELAERKKEPSKVQALEEIERKLEHSKLVQEKTFCHENMTEAERKWLRQKSTPEARRWNVLSNLSVEHLVTIYS